ncbi:uncharacterized protein A1O9_12226 [Exophiala aquamarina CBS 119918]|uniref:Major facilitator superfamily (MFS) profile domain-containing protein n=1 Tax=Exophiala aquamarina CBS 119918 TaxID=1182545 RepID=A0A072NVE5_9EURO|nr:uncharacterized protein A1O9_12226 [Exophiala aquamarina CBS 119918]KEF51591.1 hypothetical protein A1O9_12226 [Exophiala aquamarina CBS 119918]
MGLGFVGPIVCGFLMMASVLQQIGEALGDTESLSWLVGGWTISSSVAFSMAGSVSDILGRRYVLLSAQVFAIIGCIIAATCTKTRTMIAAEVLIGFGCGTMFTSYAAIQELLPKKYRGIGIAWTELPNNLPWGSLSVIIALQLTVHASWRWIYYIGIIYSTISLVGMALFYFPPRPQNDYDKTIWQELLSLDYIGLLLYTGGLTTFLLGFTWAGTTEHPWKSASVITPIVTGFLALVALIAYDALIPARPLFPWPLLNRFQDYTAYLVLLFVAGMVFVTLTSMAPVVSLYLFTHNPMEIGLISAPYGCLLIVSDTIIPALIHKIGHIKYQLLTLIVIQTLFNALYTVAIPNNRAAWIAFLCLGTPPFTAITGLSYVAASLKLTPQQLGTAMGLLGTVRNGGGSVGNAIFHTILTSVVNGRLAPRISEAALAHGFPAAHLAKLIPATLEDGAGVPGVLAAVPSMSPEVTVAVRQAFKDVYTYGFRAVFYSTIPFGVLAIICTLFINDPSDLLTNQVEVRMEKHVLNQSLDQRTLSNGQHRRKSANGKQGLK